MRDDSSIFEIFQDPLLTIVALILMGTLWIIIPGGGVEPLNGQSPVNLQQEIAKLEDDIKLSSTTIEDLENAVQRLKKLFYATGEAAHADSGEKINELHKQIVELTIAIQDKKEELKRLEQELQKRHQTAAEVIAVQELRKRIGELQGDIAEKDAYLEKLKKDLEQAKKEQYKIQHQEEGRKRLENDVNRQINIEKKKITQTQSENKALEDYLNKAGGIGAYSEDAVRDKDQVGFEAAEIKLIAIEDKNYDIKGSVTIYNGQLVQEKELTKKKSITGESVAKIIEQDSEFQKLLKKHNPLKEYIIFAVRKDSFSVFLKARQIAWEKGFKVAWFPQDDGPLYVSPYASKGEGR